MPKKCAAEESEWCLYTISRVELDPESIINAVPDGQGFIVKKSNLRGPTRVIISYAEGIRMPGDGSVILTSGKIQVQSVRSEGQAQILMEQVASYVQACGIEFAYDFNNGVMSNPHHKNPRVEERLDLNALAVALIQSNVPVAYEPEVSARLCVYPLETSFCVDVMPHTVTVAGLKGVSIQDVRKAAGILRDIRDTDDLYDRLVNLSSLMEERVL